MQYLDCSKHPFNHVYISPTKLFYKELSIILFTNMLPSAYFAYLPKYLISISQRIYEPRCLDRFGVRHLNMLF